MTAIKKKKEKGMMSHNFPSYLFSHFVIHEVYELHCKLGNAMSVQFLPWSVPIREFFLQTPG